jgi:hypothetical protein
LTDEQAAMIAAAILPDIRAYIDAHREEYEEFLKGWNERHGEAVN